jgi:hypothetical protein
VIALAGSYGDVDRDGEIVDVLVRRLRRRRRLTGAIGEHRAVDVDAASQLRLVEELLERARARRPGC